MRDEQLLEYSDEEVEMSFLDHLEELRRRIIYSIVVVFVSSIVCWIFIDPLVEYVLLYPAKTAGVKLQNLKPFGQLILFIQTAFLCGFVVSLPFVFAQIWLFVAPALKKNEKKYFFSIMFFTAFCFALGALFALYIMLPMALEFASKFGTLEIENNFSLEEYVSLLFSVILGAGIIFELPVISFFLSRIGVLTPSFMRKYRRHAIVIIMILAAFLTPGPDPMSQLILAAPLFLLYEISILISSFAQIK